MRYIGSKARVLEFLQDCIHSCVAYRKGAVFADLFAGTTAVAQHFKKLGYRIISNDYMAFSYVLQIALIQNNGTPPFSKLKMGKYLDVLDYLNSLSPIRGFFYKNYCKRPSLDGEVQRNYFSVSNAGRIDAVMETMRKWKRKNSLSFIEEDVLRTSLINAVTRVSNISGTYGAFLNRDDPRKFKRLKLEPLTFITSNEEHACFNEDTLSLIDKVSGDILYLDPPYNQRQYPPYYHILETISLDDNPAIYGKTGRRPYKDKLSPLCIKAKVKDALYSLVEKAKFKHVFLSYNTEGLLSVEDIKEILSEFGKSRVFFHGYRRYKSNSNGKNEDEIKEILFYVYKKYAKNNVKAPKKTQEIYR